MTADQVALLVVAALIMLAFGLCGVVMRCLTLLDSERQRGNRAARDAAGARADANTWARRARTAEADLARLRRGTAETVDEHVARTGRAQRKELAKTQPLPQVNGVAYAHSYGDVT